MNTSSWPKHIPPLTPEQQRISDDFMRHWHEVLPRKYGVVDAFNHEYAVRHAPANFVTTLEVGAGLGEHLSYEQLTTEQRRNYVALDIRANMLEGLRERFPDVKTTLADCQQTLPFPSDHFDRVLAIHVLEHLPNLPAAISELHRVCKQNGVLSVVIPCEGGFAYGLARRISAQRIFEKRYGQSYDWHISREHINKPDEITHELDRHFAIVHRSFFPLRIPFVSPNLCIGLTFRPR